MNKVLAVILALIIKSGSSQSIEPQPTNYPDLSTKNFALSIRQLKMRSVGFRQSVQPINLVILAKPKTSYFMSRFLRSQVKYSEVEPLYLQFLAILKQKLGQDHPHTQTVMSSLMMLRSQMSTGMSSETLQQMIAENPDDIIRLLPENNPDN